MEALGIRVRRGDLAKEKMRRHISNVYSRRAAQREVDPDIEVVALKEDGCPKVWVVTSDLYQQQAAHGAGAFVWSCKALVTEMKTSQREFEEILKEQRSTSMQGKLLKCNLDPEVVDALKDLKKLLPED